MKVPESLSILYVGTRSGTCLQRASGLAQLGHVLEFVDTGVPRSGLTRQLFRLANKLGRPPDVFGANRRIVDCLRLKRFAVLWIDKGLSIKPSVLRSIQQLSPSTFKIHYSPDDMFNPANQSPRYIDSIDLYDLHVTTKTCNV